METKYIRQIAVKTTIKELLLGTYLQEEEQSPNYLLTTKQQKIYRLNLITTVVYKEKVGSITNFLVDDGTGKITLRLFEENKNSEKINIGDTVLVIGKIRDYNQEKYVSPEIIKVVSTLWLNVRALELKKLEQEENFTEGEKISKEKIENVTNKVKFVEEKLEEESLLPIDKIKNIIVELDSGEGVLIEEVIEKSPLEGTEELIKKMLEKGDIFQNNPGKVKVL